MSDHVSPEGIKYYNELINSMLSHGIAPMVTIHHYDIPQRLQILGGWTNPKMIDYFQDFARAAFFYFGDRVSLKSQVNATMHLNGYRSSIG